MNKFDYTYSVPTEEERKKTQPAPTGDGTLLKLRELDKKIRRPAEIITYILGVVGVLVFGTGMSMSMTDLGGGVILGSVVGIVGIIILAVNYKIYKYILKRRKAKYADELRKLTGGLIS